MAKSKHRARPWPPSPDVVQEYAVSVVTGIHRLADGTQQVETAKLADFDLRQQGNPGRGRRRLSVRDEISRQTAITQAWPAADFDHSLPRAIARTLAGISREFDAPGDPQPRTFWEAHRRRFGKELSVAVYREYRKAAIGFPDCAPGENGELSADQMSAIQRAIDAWCQAEAMPLLKTLPDA